MNLHYAVGWMRQEAERVLCDARALLDSAAPPQGEFGAEHEEDHADRAFAYVVAKLNRAQVYLLALSAISTLRVLVAAELDAPIDGEHTSIGDATRAAQRLLEGRS